MNDVKLTDFSVEQLEILLVEVVHACEKLAYEHVGLSPKGYFLVPNEKYETLCLWRVQILNAISTVKMRNIPQQN